MYIFAATSTPGPRPITESEMTESVEINGILVVDKPGGMTSHDVVAQARCILKTKRVGHTGTLDPFATGVLVLLIGKATRLAQFIDKDEKEYEAVVRFGFETDTGDKTGVWTTGGGLSADEIDRQLSDLNWDNVLDKFRGEIKQVPPMYSAKKVKGKKLYELARAGKEIDRKPVSIEIKKLEIVRDGQIRSPDSEIRIRVVCSAGTYVRTLAEDIGRHIGIGAHLKELRRTRAGRFGLDQSITFDQFDSAQEASQYLRPIEEAVSHLPPFLLSDDRVDKTRSGLPTRTDSHQFRDGEHVRMIDAKDCLLAVGIFHQHQSQVKPMVVLT